MQSVISLDLGGKYTGYFSYTSDNISQIKDFQSGNIVYDGNFVISQAQRRTYRHAKRGNLRRQLAKRLFLLILNDYYACSLAFLPDFIAGLFNRRGYNRQSVEKDPEAVNQDVFLDFLSAELDAPIDGDLDDYIEENLALDLERFSDFYARFGALSADYKTRPGYKECDKEEQKVIQTGFSELKKILDAIQSENSSGALPRSVYFKKMGEEIDTNALILDFFKEKNLDKEQMKNLIANISNLRLKELRRYFNDPQFAKKNDFLAPKRLHKILWRFACSWHPKDEVTKQRQKAFQKAVGDPHQKGFTAPSKERIVSFFTQTDPLVSIPPYEDMNNRGAVKCLALRLNTRRLDELLPRWQEITDKLSSALKERLIDLDEDLQECSLPLGDDGALNQNATLLHRILDLSRDLDPLALRALSSLKPSDVESFLKGHGANSKKLDSLQEHLRDLAAVLGSEAPGFLNFAREYYTLIRTKVRVGIWSAQANASAARGADLFKACNHNPPYKNNQLHSLVGSCLGIRLEPEMLKNFEKDLWSARLGTKTLGYKLSAYCKKLEDLRSLYGNDFKAKIEAGAKDGKKDDDDKKIEALKNALGFWVGKIAEFFGIDAARAQSFSNFFSMAQLYNIVENSRSGFNSTCKYCSAENAFRMQRIQVAPGYGAAKPFSALCQRLPSNTQRPFSGKIERYLDKLAFELARIKRQEILAAHRSGALSAGKSLELKIILEQNEFEYEASIRDAKIKDAKKDKLKVKKERHERAIKSKTERIKSFSNGICPYCERPIGIDGEIDHILPRSFTLKEYGTVFNGEGNLLYVCAACNKAKGDNQNFPNKFKDTMTPKQINEIIDGIRVYKAFYLLNALEQRAFRAALFLSRADPAFLKVVAWLRTEISSFVNGTQKYVASKIAEKLGAMLPAIHFDFDIIVAPSQDVSALRDKFAKQDPRLKKPERQTNASHTIDAIVAFASVYEKLADGANPITPATLLDYVSINNTVTKPIGKIQKSARNNLAGAKIFNDGFYKERFAMLFYHKSTDKYYAGAVLGLLKDPLTNRVTKELDTTKLVEVKKEDYERIRPYLGAAQDLGGVVAFKPKRQEILDLFHAISINGGAQDLLQTAAVLDRLSYNLKKTPVLETPGVLKSKALQTNIYGKTIDLGLRDEWQKFHDSLQKHFSHEYASRKIDDIEKGGVYNLDADKFLAFCRAYFKDTSSKTPSSRHRTRRQFSLPVVNSPSGGFRIQRQRPNGERFYQLLAIDHGKVAGLATVEKTLKNGEKKIESKDVLIKELALSKRVSLKNPEQKFYTKDSISIESTVDLSQKLGIKGVSVRMQISSGRQNVALSMPTDKFLSICTHKDYLSLPQDLKLGSAQELRDAKAQIDKDGFNELFSANALSIDKPFAPRSGKITLSKASKDEVRIEFSNEAKRLMSLYLQTKAPSKA
ncbi:MAG: type II-B CRISPR-associated RNA-guided endonuclease Cas9/Csx12 [Helicobacteraceae bacterium]